MPISLSKADHKKLDVTINAILEAYGSGKASLGEARGALAHIIAAAAIGNESELRGWLKPDTVADWKSDLHA